MKKTSNKTYLDKPKKDKTTKEQLLFGNGIDISEKKKKDEQYRLKNLNE